MWCANGYFGDERKFELFERSPLKQLILEHGGRSLYLSDLADRVTDSLYSARTTIEEASRHLKLGDRAVPAKLAQRRRRHALRCGHIEPVPRLPGIPLGFPPFPPPVEFP